MCSVSHLPLLIHYMVVPFHEVCEALKVVRSSSRTSVFQAMFALQEREWHSVDDLSPEKGEDDVSFNVSLQLNNKL